MSDRTLAQLRRDRRAEIARLKTLRAKISALIESAGECDEADRNGQVANCAYDIKRVGVMAAMSGRYLLQTCKATERAKEADAQRQAEIDHADLLGVMHDIVMSASPAPNVVRGAFKPRLMAVAQGEN